MRLRLWSRCSYCGGRGWYSDGRRWFDGFRVDDDVEDYDCECCRGTGQAGLLWPVVWLWRRLRAGCRWLRNWLDYEPIPF